MNPQIIPAQAKLMSRLRLRTLTLTLTLALTFASAWGQTVHVYIPSSLSARRVGDTIDVPILVSGQTGLGIISADIAICFREAVLTGTTVCRSGNAAPGWTAFANPLPCTVLVAAMGADPLVAGDTLLVLRMRVDAGDTTTLTFARCRLNEGQVACTTSIGRFVGLGIEETPTCEVRATNRLPTVVRGTLWLGGTGIPTANGQGRENSPAVLLDAMGREVLALEPGSNDLHRLAPGVYFLSSGAPGQCEARRLVLMR